MKPNKNGETTFHSRTFPTQLKADIKAWAHSRGYTLEEVVEALCRRLLATNMNISQEIAKVRAKRRARRNGRNYLPTELAAKYGLRKTNETELPDTKDGAEDGNTSGDGYW